MSRKHDVNWPAVWSQVQAALERNNAPDDVIRSARPSHVGWNYGDGKFYLFCSETLYRWLEVPPSPDRPSNLSLIKPIIWPLMQRYCCKDLVYRIIKPIISIRH